MTKSERHDDNGGNETSEESLPAYDEGEATNEKNRISLNEVKGEGFRVFIARHGERLDFVDGDWRSTSKYPDDPPLTPRGEQQARELGERLRNTNITQVYASPFQRALRTACIATSQFSDDILINVEPGLCEKLSNIRYWKTKNGPLWHTVKELSESDQAGLINNKNYINLNYKPIFSNDHNFIGYPESSIDTKQRCSKVLNDVLLKNSNRNKKGNILLVGHISSVKGLLYALVPNISIPIKIPYCCLSIVEASSHTSSDGQPQSYWKVNSLCDNSFHSSDSKLKSDPQGGGYGRTKYLINIARGVFYTTLLKSNASSSSSSSSTPYTNSKIDSSSPTTKSISKK